MRDSCSTSSLEIIEKKEPRRRPAGCVGVFFQLFDWKKKKHFSKKLLPPVTAAKRMLRKFGDHEKLPVAKHLVIPQDNGGAFSAMKRSGNGTSCSSPCKPVKGMYRAPSLVARLMGLESMPIVHHGNTRNALDSQSNISHGKVSNLEGVKCRRVGSRTQELKKTGRLSRSQPSGNAFQFDMSVEQQRKLASLVKSQRMSSKRKKKARLMEVAARILEPGLQSKNRIKFAITNAGISSNTAEGFDGPSVSNEPDEPLHYDLHVGSCANCGNLVEVVDLRSSAKIAQELDHRYGALDSNDGSLSFSSFNVPEDSKLERKVLQSNQKRANGTLAFTGEDTKRSSLTTANSGSRGAPTVQAKINVHSMRNVQDRCRRHENVASKFALKQNNLRQNHLPSVNEKFESRSKERSRRHCTRDLNAMHRAKKFSDTMTCRDRTSQKNVMRLGRSDLDKDDMVPKRRPITVSGQMPNGDFMKQRSCRKESTTCKISGSVETCSKIQNRLRSESFKVVNAGNGSKKESSTNSPTFGSRDRHKSRSTSFQNMVERRTCIEKLTSASSPKELVSDAESESLSSSNEKHMLSKVEEDALFAHLEDKFTDLSYFEENNLQIDNDFPRTPAPLILERMTSAILNRGSSSHKNDDSSYCLYSPQKIQDDKKHGMHPVYSASHGDRSTLMSTLEASFSGDNRYCLKPNWRSDGGQEIDDQIPLVKVGKFQIDKLPTSISNKASIHRSSSDGTRLKKTTKFNYSSDAASNTELLFESAGKIYYLVDSFFRNTETLRTALGSSIRCSTGGAAAGEGNPLTQLLLDCIVECLGSLYSSFYYDGCTGWFRFQLLMSKNRLAKLVEADIVSWHRMAGQSLSELVEHDVRRPNADWPSVKRGGFELSEEMEDEVLQLLMNELVEDLAAAERRYW